MQHSEIWFLGALAFTAMTETAVLFLVSWRVLNLRSIGPLQMVYGGVLANASSLPYLWFVLPQAFKSYSAYAVTGEVGVFLWEALFYFMYFRIPPKDALVLSFTANLASFLLGLLIFR